MLLRFLAFGLALVAAAGAADEAKRETLRREVRAIVEERARAAGITLDPWRRGAPELGAWAFNNYRFRRGDDARWAERDFDDSEWTRITPYELPARDGVYWVRWKVTQRSAAASAWRDGLLLKVVASYDLYWDGQLIGRNGRVGATAGAEEPGMVDALFQVPRELLGAGEHTVALRLSSFHTGFPGPNYGLNFAWGNFRTMLVERSRTSLLSVMAVGASLVGAGVFGLLWLLAGRRRPLLIFSALLVTVAALQALQAWRWLFDYPYDWHYPRLVAITALASALAVLLAAFVLEQFALRLRGWTALVLAGLLTHAWFSSPIYNWVSLYACTAGFAAALALAVRAVWLRRRGAAAAGAGLALSMVALITAPRDFLDHAFFLSAGPAMVGLTVAVVLQLRDERREAEQAKLTAARLEIELLKKNIQPHFLVNTLATLIEVIEQDPRAAVGLIEALAGEFRILARVSGEKLIPLEQEIELCRAHLRVMSLRRGVRSALTVRGAAEGLAVPPALLHTLVENGLTHLLPRSGRQDFELTVERRATGTRLALLARGERQAEADTAAAGGGGREGTGLRYVKARLEESFPAAWTLAGAAVPEGWETVIEVRGPMAAAGGSAGASAAGAEGAPRALPRKGAAPA